MEGYLSPNTYEIYTGADADSIIRKLLTQTSATFLSNYAERAENLGMSMDEIFTLASMIEKEAKTADFAKVSAVFHNRLKLNMTLGSDATVKYESGSQKMSLDENDLAEDSLYNTYLYRGLPIGPICNPSMDAVVAALYPDEQFVAQNIYTFVQRIRTSGELHFSRTLKNITLQWQCIGRCGKNMTKAEVYSESTRVITACRKYENFKNGAALRCRRRLLRNETVWLTCTGWKSYTRGN